MNKNFDFSICPFIEESMWFFTYEDFCENRYIIKRLFKILTANEKLLYRWYVYANVHTNELQKNRIWDYLNDYDPDAYNLLKPFKYKH